MFKTYFMQEVKAPHNQETTSCAMVAGSQDAANNSFRPASALP